MVKVSSRYVLNWPFIFRFVDILFIFLNLFFFFLSDFIYFLHYLVFLTIQFNFMLRIELLVKSQPIKVSFFIPRSRLCNIILKRNFSSFFICCKKSALIELVRVNAIIKLCEVELHFSWVLTVIKIGFSFGVLCVNPCGLLPVNWVF